MKGKKLITKGDCSKYQKEKKKQKGIILTESTALSGHNRAYPLICPRFWNGINTKKIATTLEKFKHYLRMIKRTGVIAALPC